ncbi:YdcF family protein [Microbacterium gilvum]|uniref:DUF218 domain-containing protein n=1 Tax=Microbacterium gilvum TaxID=1336204 RepID=A0ABP8ZVX5_9MICO
MIARVAVAGGPVLAAVAVLAAGVAAGEVVNRVAARRALGSHAEDGRTVVVALGFRNAGGRINAVNRWRVRAALATADRDDADLLVFSGGSPGGRIAEADLMAAYAGETGRTVARESASRTTWENLLFTTPFLEGATRIVLVSNPLHAERARQDLRRQRPDLADRLSPAVDVRDGAWIVLLPLAALYEIAVRAWFRARGPRVRARA